MLRQMQPGAVTCHALPGQQLIDQRSEHLPRQIRGRQPAQAPAFEAEHLRGASVFGRERRQHFLLRRLPAQRRKTKAAGAGDVDHHHWDLAIQRLGSLGAQIKTAREP